jgi:hypothetical protein
MKIEIEILKKDIEESSYLYAPECAITKALQRAVNRRDVRHVGYTDIVIGNKRVIGIFPQDARDKVVAMYQAIGKLNLPSLHIDPVKPEDFKFEIDIPEKYLSEPITII